MISGKFEAYNLQFKRIHL